MFIAKCEKDISRNKDIKCHIPHTQPEVTTPPFVYSFSFFFHPKHRVHCFFKLLHLLFFPHLMTSIFPCQYIFILSNSFVYSNFLKWPSYTVTVELLNPSFSPRPRITCI